MIRWEKFSEEDGFIVYQRIDEDGLVRVTAVRGYPELEEYLTLVADNPEYVNWFNEQENIGE